MSSWVNRIVQRDSLANTPQGGYKYHGDTYNQLILKDITRFLVFYTLQGGTEKSDWFSGVRH